VWLVAASPRQANYRALCALRSAKVNVRFSGVVFEKHVIQFFATTVFSKSSVIHFLATAGFFQKLCY